MKIAIPDFKALFLGRYGSLLACLLFMMILQPTIDTQIGKFILEVFFIAVLLAGLRAIQVDKGLLRFEVVLLVVSLACGAAGSLMDHELLFLLGLAGRALFLILVALSILLDLFRGSEVTGDKLAGAVCVYLLIALIWGYAFLITEFVTPESFSFTQGNERLQLWVSREFFPFFYFSMVTMTTVGYGDMAPVTTVAQTLATTEALVGQVYLTILVARLVGMFLMHQQKPEE
ncbi:MAG: potassium channel family protein [Desulfuromonadales bacterium]|jgi:hypothetical protein